ncbi:hypothetical protein IPG41_04820 [Candidatus Peregrinibacteria bacterium]|nr:MAG: hypothetical protein IPG41_04820 [Candidatus Peregrinibacteria bacterium]
MQSPNQSLSRREALVGLLATFAMASAPKSAAAAISKQIDETREQLTLPTFIKYENPAFGRAEHEAFHKELEARYGFAKDPHLTRWTSNPEQVYVNKNAGESIHIVGVNLKENYAEMVWVLAPAYINAEGQRVLAHVPFEHIHSNQEEQFEKLCGEVNAQVNGVILQAEKTDFFSALPEDDHIAWNSGATPLAMRVRYYPAFGRDGERALMTYWGLVNEPERTTDTGAPKNFALLGALNAHLGPQALATGMPAFLPKVAHPFLVNPLNRKEVCDLYRELTGEEHPEAIEAREP